MRDARAGAERVSRFRALSVQRERGSGRPPSRRKRGRRRVLFASAFRDHVGEISAARRNGTERVSKPLASLSFPSLSCLGFTARPTPTRQPGSRGGQRQAPRGNLAVHGAFTSLGLTPPRRIRPRARRVPFGRRCTALAEVVLPRPCSRSATAQRVELAACYTSFSAHVLRPRQLAWPRPLPSYPPHPNQPSHFTLYSPHRATTSLRSPSSYQGEGSDWVVGNCPQE